MAYKRVRSNKGAGVLDKTGVDELLPYHREHRERLVEQIREGKHKPSPQGRITQGRKGKARPLGMTTAVSG